MRQPYILKRPIITEKSMAQTAMNWYTFEVDLKATKGQIKDAVEKAFAVNVTKVKTAKMAGKRRRVGKIRREVKRPDRKKAIVKLADGQKIDVFEVKS